MNISNIGIAFQNSDWFWGLLILPVLYLIFRFDHQRRLHSLNRFADPAMWSLLSPEFDSKARPRKSILWMLALACFILAATRPQWGKREEVVKVTGMDVLFVLDVSHSMEAEDVPPSRLREAKHLIRRMVDDLASDRVGLVLFAASNYLAVPLTTDHTYFGEMLNYATPQTVSNQGTDIGLALETAAKALDRGAEDPTQNQDSQQLPTKAVVLITDGEDQEGQLATGASRLKDTGASLFVIGIGTEKGSPLPVRDESGVLRGYKKDRSGQAVISQFSGKGLQQVTEATGGEYWHHSGDSDINAILDEMHALNRVDFNERKIVSYVDRYQIFLLLGILFLMIEMSTPGRRLKLMKAAAAAMFLIVIPARADVPIESYLETEKGVKAYEGKKIEEARKHFGNAQAHEPSSPHLNYNQGVITLEQEDFKSAEKIFENSARAAEALGDSNLAGRAYYNLGEAQAKNGQNEEAAKSYLSALDQALRTKDEELATDARKKLQALVQQQKQKSQQSKDGDKGKEGDQDSSQKKDGEDSGDDKKDDQGGNDDKKFKPTPESARKDQFKSKKLKKDDADRVMQELGDKEQEAMKRYKIQKGQSAPAEKDW